MNRDLMQFTFDQHAIRVVMQNGEPWWVAKDVCDALGHSNSRVSLDRLDADEKGVSTVYTPGGPQQMAVINEAGLYRLIFTSRVEAAERFKRWLAHDVLPTIRRTGEYKTKERKQKDEASERRLAIMELNAKTRQAKLIFDVTQRFRDRLSDIAIESLLAVGANVLTGKDLLPLPTSERLYSATEIGTELGISANKVGRIANQLGLKTEEYGVHVLDKSPYSSKQVDSFRYNERGRQRILEFYQNAIALNTQPREE